MNLRPVEAGFLSPDHGGGSATREHSLSRLGGRGLGGGWGIRQCSYSWVAGTFAIMESVPCPNDELVGLKADKGRRRIAMFDTVFRWSTSTAMRNSGARRQRERWPPQTRHWQWTITIPK